jgi:glucokinase
VTASLPVSEVAVALDLGGTKIAAGLVTPQGRLVDRDQFVIDHDLDAEALWTMVASLVEHQLRRAIDHHRARPVVVGVGSAGPVAPEVETVSPLNIAAWDEFPLRGRLRELTGLEVFGAGYVKALALAEGWLGAAVGRENFLAMVVSTGVGGGVVLDGRLLEGSSGNAGHVGHIVVEPNGRRCRCGARGCLEAEASGPAIEAITGRPPDQPTYAIMQRTGRLTGLAAASVCNLLDLDLVVVGGSVALGFGAPFFLAAQETLSEHCQLAFSRSARITPARLENQGPLIGAGAVGWRGHWRMLRAR